MIRRIGWITIVLAVLVAGVEAAGPKPVCDPNDPDCPLIRRDGTDRGRSATPANPAVGRICNETAGVASYGSGTLIEEAGRPLVLTCAHIFSEGVGRITIGFAGGRKCDAELLAIDKPWDLAVLAVPRQSATPVAIADDYPEIGDEVTSSGWGNDDLIYRSNRGSVVGYESTTKTGSHETLVMTGFARPGDSGGPILNRRGELVAVCWGSDGRAVVGTFCGRIRRFLRGVVRPLVPVDRGTPDRAGQPNALDDLNKKPDQQAGGQERAAKQSDERLARIEADIAGFAGLDTRLERAEAAVSPESLQAIVGGLVAGATEQAAAATEQAAGATDRAPSLMNAAIPAILAGFGWTGPPAIAAVVGLRILAAVTRRRRKRKRLEGTAGKPAEEFPPPETVGSLPRDDEEARQFLQLSRLEGRAPLHDALVGRIAFDELDNAIDAQPDGPRADWARALRRKLEDRFNEMAPPALYR